MFTPPLFTPLPSLHSIQGPPSGLVPRDMAFYFRFWPPSERRPVPSLSSARTSHFKDRKTLTLASAMSPKQLTTASARTTKAAILHIDSWIPALTIPNNNADTRTRTTRFARPNLNLLRRVWGPQTAGLRLFMIVIIKTDGQPLYLPRGSLGGPLWPGNGEFRPGRGFGPLPPPGPPRGGGPPDLPVDG